MRLLSRVIIATISALACCAQAQTQSGPDAEAPGSLAGTLQPGLAPDATTQPIQTPQVETVTGSPDFGDKIDLTDATPVTLQIELLSATAAVTSASNEAPAPQSFRSLACDLGLQASSRPWLNGGYAYFGQQIFVPLARGTELPNGSVHDGLFTCDLLSAVPRAARAHLFVGHVTSHQQAKSLSPFDFLNAPAAKGVAAFVLP